MTTCPPPGKITQKALSFAGLDFQPTPWPPSEQRSRTPGPPSSRQLNLLQPSNKALLAEQSRQLIQQGIDPKIMLLFHNVYIILISNYIKY